MVGRSTGHETPSLIVAAAIVSGLDKPASPGTDASLFLEEWRPPKTQRVHVACNDLGVVRAHRPDVHPP